MAVTIADVRAALNDISEEELSSSTIQIHIDDGTAVWPTHDRIVRSYAAWKSFGVSKVYKKFKMGPMSGERDLDMFLDSLKMQFDDARKQELGASSYVLESTIMLDDRPDSESYV